MSSIENLSKFLNLNQPDFNLDTTRSVAARKKTETPKTDIEAAQEKLQDAKKQVTESTFKAWDKHTDMVEKSQELRKVKNREDAIKRLNKERDDAQDELRAKMAIENANRVTMLEESAMKRRFEQEAALA